MHENNTFPPMMFQSTVARRAAFDSCFRERISLQLFRLQPRYAFVQKGQPGAAAMAQPLLLTEGAPAVEAEMRGVLPVLLNTPRPEHSLLRLHWDNNITFATDYAAQLAGPPQQGGTGNALVCFKVQGTAGCGLNAARVPGSMHSCQCLAVYTCRNIQAPHCTGCAPQLDTAGRQRVPPPWLPSDAPLLVRGAPVLADGAGRDGPPQPPRRAAGRTPIP